MAGTFYRAGLSRGNNCDIVRLGLALMVMFSHCYPLTHGRAALEPLCWLTGGAETLGGVAVAGFFAVSGFLIANSWATSRGLFDFLRRRAARIFPGLVAAVLFAAFVVGPLASYGHYRFARAARSAITAIRYVDEPSLPGLFEHNPLPGSANGSLWTVGYELRCYVAVAALGVTGLLRRRWFVLGCFVALLGVYVAADVLPSMGGKALAWRATKFFAGSLESYKAPRFAAFFAAGTCFWAFRECIPKSPWLCLAAAIGLTAASFLGSPVLHAVFPVLGVYLLFSFVFSDSIRLHGFGKHGDCSYGVYLYAWPVTQCLVSMTGAQLPIPLLFVWVFIGTMPLAVLSWFFVERPFLRAFRGRSSRARVGESPAKGDPEIERSVLVGS